MYSITSTFSNGLNNFTYPRSDYFDEFLNSGFSLLRPSLFFLCSYWSGLKSRIRQSLRPYLGRSHLLRAFYKLASLKRAYRLSILLLPCHRWSGRSILIHFACPSSSCQRNRRHRSTLVDHARLSCRFGTFLRKGCQIGTRAFQDLWQHLDRLCLVSPISLRDVDFSQSSMRMCKLAVARPSLWVLSVQVLSICLLLLCLCF